MIRTKDVASRNFPCEEKGTDAVLDPSNRAIRVVTPKSRLSGEMIRNVDAMIRLSASLT